MLEEEIMNRPAQFRVLAPCLSLLFAAVVSLMAAAPAQASEIIGHLPKNVDTAIIQKYVQGIGLLAAHPTVIDAVRTQNEKGFDRPRVEEIERRWRVTPASDPMKIPFMVNSCSQLLKQFARVYSATFELFVMDAQGALVCTVKPTSDYWQGDENKWKKTVPAGPESLFIDEPRYDESAKAETLQISLTIADAGAPIGAITLGVHMNQISTPKTAMAGGSSGSRRN